MSAPTPSSTTPSRIWSTAPSTIPANAAAASSASMSSQAVYDDFVEGFADLTRKYVAGQSARCGDHARADGARLLRRLRCAARSRRRGGKAPRPLINMKVRGRYRAGSPYLAPEVLANVNHQMEVMREESFGPVVGIMKVRDDEEAITLMNDSPYGLTASIWTRDTDRGRRDRRADRDRHDLYESLRLSRPDLTWTGVKDTGRGAALSKYGFDALTQPKSFHLRDV